MKFLEMCSVLVPLLSLTVNVRPWGNWVSASAALNSPQISMESLPQYPTAAEPSKLQRIL